MPRGTECLHHQCSRLDLQIPQLCLAQAFALSSRSPGTLVEENLAPPMLMKRMNESPRRTRKKSGRRRSRTRVLEEDDRSKERKKKRSPSPPPSDSSDDDSGSDDSSSESMRLARIIRKQLKKQQRKAKDRDCDPKAKEADKILIIPKFPAPEKHRDWKIKVRDNIAAASAKPDEARTWAGKVNADAQTIDAKGLPLSTPSCLPA